MCNIEWCLILVVIIWLFNCLFVFINFLIVVLFDFVVLFVNIILFGFVFNNCVIVWCDWLRYLCVFLLIECIDDGLLKWDWYIFIIVFIIFGFIGVVVV